MGKKNYAKGIGMIMSACPSLDCDDEITRLDQFERYGLLHYPPDSCVDVVLPGVPHSRSGLVIKEGVDATIEMANSTRHEIPRDGEDGHRRAIFGAKSSCVATNSLASWSRKWGMDT